MTSAKIDSRLVCAINRTIVFPELDTSATIVRFIQHAVRHHSQLFEFEVTDKSFTWKVIYKVAFSPQAMNAAITIEERPRLFSPPDAASNGLREYRALESVEQHFSRLFVSTNAC